MADLGAAAVTVETVAMIVAQTTMVLFGQA